jgi:hypothetical protein
LPSDTAAHAEAICNNAWCFLEHLYDKGGVTVVGLFFVAFVFYKLVWKVWSSAMKAKDDEIERLIAERDFYQEQSFPKRISSDQVKPN